MRKHLQSRDFHLAVMGLLLLGTPAFTGCMEWEVYRCDLANPADETATEDRIKASLARELTAQSTVEDGFKWFERHHIPLYTERQTPNPLSIQGGFNVFQTQGFWFSDSLMIELRFGPDGKYLSYHFDWSESCL